MHSISGANNGKYFDPGGVIIFSETYESMNEVKIIINNNNNNNYNNKYNVINKGLN